MATRAPTPLVHWGILVALALCGCGPDQTPPPSSTSSGASTTTGSSSSGTDTSASAGSQGEESSTDSGEGSGETSGETGDSQECVDCYAPLCEAESEACATDSVCTCWLGCEGEDCESQCGSSEVFVELFVCIADAQVGPCQWACGDDCDSCVYLDCKSEFETCFGDPICLCALNCEGDTDCVDACGTSPAFPPVRDCLVLAGSGECADICGG